MNHQMRNLGAIDGVDFTHFALERFTFDGIIMYQKSSDFGDTSDAISK